MIRIDGTILVCILGGGARPRWYAEIERLLRDQERDPAGIEAALERLALDRRIECLDGRWSRIVP